MDIPLQGIDRQAIRNEGASTAADPSSYAAYNALSVASVPLPRTDGVARPTATPAKAGAPAPPARQVIVKLIVSFCRENKVLCVAEGIEDEETALSLHKLGCPIGQGYHLGYPVPPADILQLFESGRAGAATKASSAA